jgi:hypothetical protein
MEDEIDGGGAAHEPDPPITMASLETLMAIRRMEMVAEISFATPSGGGRLGWFYDLWLRDGDQLTASEWRAIMAATENDTPATPTPTDDARKTIDHLLHGRVPTKVRGELGEALKRADRDGAVGGIAKR